MENLNSQGASDEPLYNIGVVSRMTGISVATLRAWERRYGFPSSGRTAGGHRLYSERDMGRLRWVKNQIDQGMQTAQAIQVLRHHEASGRPASDGASEQEPWTASIPPAIEEALLPDAGWGSLREELTAALMRHDLTAGDRILGAALLNRSVEELITKLIQPTLVTIGEAWQEKRLTVATEHLASHYLRHRLLMWMLSGPPLYPVKPVMLACAPGELHEGSLLILGVLLRRRRWPVAYLGQTMPLPDLASLVHDMEPPIVVMVAMTEPPAQALLEWPRYLPEAATTGRPVMAFGGRVFTEEPAWRERVPGVFLGETIQEGVARLDQWLAARMATEPTLATRYP